MSVNVNYVYDIMKYAVNKNQNGYLSSEEFDRVINLGQDSYVAYLLGNFQTYSPGRPISRVEFGQNSIVRQRLTPVIYGYNLNVDSTGFSPYPLDYMQTDAMWSIYGYNRVRWVGQEKWWSTYNSVIDPRTSNPIYMIKDDGFEFAPTDIGQAKLSYIRTPPRIYWGYVLDPQGRRVYSPINSIDPIWDATSILEIIVRALVIVGLNLQLREVENYSQIIKTQGQ